MLALRAYQNIISSIWGENREENSSCSQITKLPLLSCFNCLLLSFFFLCMTLNQWYAYCFHFFSFLLFFFFFFFVWFFFFFPFWVLLERDFLFFLFSFFFFLLFFFCTRHIFYFLTNWVNFFFLIWHHFLSSHFFLN